MASVLFSSSRRDTEKLRGVQLYSRTSSLNRLRSAPPQRHKEDMIRITSHQNICISNFLQHKSKSIVCLSLYSMVYPWLKNDKLQVKTFLPLAFLLWMKDFPSTCHEGLYNSSISTCHRSGSRYFMTSSTVLRPATASDNSSIPCRDGGSAAGPSGSDTLCRKTNRWDGERRNRMGPNVDTISNYLPLLCIK